MLKISTSLLTALSLFITSCDSNQKNCMHNISLFKGPLRHKFFQVKVEEDFEFLDTKGLHGKSTPWLLIKRYCAKKDSLSIYLKIDDRDTTFIYPALLTDSLIFDFNRYFLIGTNSTFPWSLHRIGLKEMP
jgi:hypothetical protein